MKRFEIGSIEVLGSMGILIWALVLFLRTRNMPNNDFCVFVIGMLPNLAAAWISTMIGKWIIVLGLKRRLTVRVYGVLCFSIMLFALCSELIYDLYFDSAFDIYDLVVTAMAQIVAFILPLLLQDKSISKQTTKAINMEEYNDI